MTSKCKKTQQNKWSECTQLSVFILLLHHFFLFLSCLAVTADAAHCCNIFVQRYDMRRCGGRHHRASTVETLSTLEWIIMPCMYTCVMLIRYTKERKEKKKKRNEFLMLYHSYHFSIYHRVIFGHKKGCCFFFFFLLSSREVAKNSMKHEIKCFTYSSKILFFSLVFCNFCVCVVLNVKFSRFFCLLLQHVALLVVIPLEKKEEELKALTTFFVVS